MKVFDELKKNERKSVWRGNPNLGKSVIASPPEAGEAIFFSCLFVIASPPKGGRGNLVFFLPLFIASLP